ncbi:MAG: RNA methyltransferase [Lachnospiraceae bacterium]|nr:RNA methyltransferase [Lachnospiraceae bacterium]
MITSATNPKLKRIASLLKKSAHRKAEGVFVIEGFKMFMEVLAQCPERFEEILFTEAAKNKMVSTFGEPVIEGLKYELVEEKLFEKIAETVTPQGVLAIVKTPAYNLSDILKDNTAKLLVLDNLRDPGNLGTIVRTAEAAGMSGILLSEGCVDITNPKVVRSTMGAILRVPFVGCERLSDELLRLKENYYGFTVYATALNGSVVFTENKYYGRCAIVIGNESNGVSPEVLAAADKKIRIPMAGKVESLNAAVAAAVVMYEVNRY